jgi:DNA-directed RNA polymerase subunit omega
MTFNRLFRANKRGTQRRMSRREILLFKDCVKPAFDYPERLVNSEYIKQALAKVGNPNVLINIVSRRVRQLTAGGGAGRPLVEQTATMGMADVALTEIIDGKMDYTMSHGTQEEEEETQPVAKKRKHA